MSKEPWELVADRLHRLIPDKADATAQEKERESEHADVDAIRSAVQGATPADIALAMADLDPAQAVVVFDALDQSRAAEVLGKLGPDYAKRVAECQPRGRLNQLLEQLPTRTAASIAVYAPERGSEVRETNESVRDARVAREVEKRRAYRDGTAGHLMTGEFVRLRPEMTVEDAIDAVRETNPDVDIPDDLYVVEQVATDGETRDRLVGAISIRSLLMSGPRQRVDNVMAKDVVTVDADATVQWAAMLVSTYEFLALPVVDEERTLLGVIPAEDLMRFAVGRMNRRYAQAVGTDAEKLKKLSAFEEAKLRVPWLLATMGIEMVAGLVIHRFDAVLQRVILLASFMPVISAISGNVGLQAAAITVRALDAGQVTDRWRAVRKEISTTLLMAAVCGIVLGSVGLVWSSDVVFAFVVGVALTSAMLTAAFMGTVIPVVSKRFGFDPATTAGPFETAFQDIIGFGIFLGLATLLSSRL